MWRGANLTIPHKEKILPLVQDPEGLVSSVGAMNIVIPDHGEAKGFNSDISGFAEPLDNVCLAGKSAALRSEEHTSELQSLMRISYAVFCLKKKKIKECIVEHDLDTRSTEVQYVHQYTQYDNIH